MKGFDLDSYERDRSGEKFTQGTTVIVNVVL